MFIVQDAGLGGVDLHKMGLMRASHWASQTWRGLPKGSLTNNPMLRHYIPDLYTQAPLVCGFI